MNIFSRLLQLYRTNSCKTPLEDFTTEILVGILSQNDELLDAFVNEILKIEGHGFTISSQEHFLSDEGIQNCKVDIIIRKEGMLCLLENKVNSSEGFEQLSRYGKVLDKYKVDYQTHLRYCTKYYDYKAIEEHGFVQFRWPDVTRFLKKHNNSELIQEYLYFLKDHHMDNNTTFSAIDIIALENLNPLIQRMEVYLQKIKPSFEKHFGKCKDVSNFRQIKDHSRFIFIKESPFGNGYNELGVGFDFKGTVSLHVWIWCGKQNNKIGLLKDIFSTQTIFETNNIDLISLKKPLSDFISSDNIEIEIEQWFINSFKTVKDFAASTPELDWKLA